MGGWGGDRRGRGRGAVPLDHLDEFEELAPRAGPPREGKGPHRPPIQSPRVWSFRHTDDLESDLGRPLCVVVIGGGIFSLQKEKTTENGRPQKKPKSVRMHQRMMLSRTVGVI